MIALTGFDRDIVDYVVRTPYGKQATLHCAKAVNFYFSVHFISIILLLYFHLYFQTGRDDPVPVDIDSPAWLATIHRQLRKLDIDLDDVP